jgi:ribulose-phosphate 3-epimerase
VGRALVAPSILSADFARLAEAATNVEATADLLHVDVMDYHFVPNLTFGVGTVEGLRRSTSLPLDCHLMIEDPDRWAPPYAEAGASSVTIHAEAAKDLRGTAAAIRQAGARVGLALKPGSGLEPYHELLEHFDMLLVMTVEPGFGGQSFIHEMLPKIRAARELLDRRGLDLWLQVDGGVNAETIELCAAAGADVFVAGSAVYDAADPSAAIERLRASAVRAANSSSTGAGMTGRPAGSG